MSYAKTKRVQYCGEIVVLTRSRVSCDLFAEYYCPGVSAFLHVDRPARHPERWSVRTEPCGVRGVGATLQAAADSAYANRLEKFRAEAEALGYELVEEII